jgi:hypothetical protein
MLIPDETAPAFAAAVWAAAQDAHSAAHAIMTSKFSILNAPLTRIRQRFGCSSQNKSRSHYRRLLSVMTAWITHACNAFGVEPGIDPGLAPPPHAYPRWRLIELSIAGAKKSIGLFTPRASGAR